MSLDDFNTDLSTDFGSSLITIPTPVAGKPSPAYVWFEIPLRGKPQKIRTLINGHHVTVQTFWVEGNGGGWAVKLYNYQGRVVIGKIMLVPYTDLLAQYAYLGLGSVLYLYSDDGVSYPTYAGLGTTSHLVWAAT